MKAFPALRLLACASLFSFVGVTTSSAQLFFHVVDVDSLHVDSGSNLGVAINATFTFSINAGVGTLQVKLTNLAGTSRAAWGDGAGNYTAGILTGFGFDAPPVGVGGLTYLGFTDDPSLSVNFAGITPYTETNPVGTFDFGAIAANPAPGNGLLSGQTATFEFKFGGNLTNFTQANFFKTNGTDADFGFRYQAVGANGSGSDKFVYYIDDNPPIPEPSTYGIVAAGLLLTLTGLKRLKARRATLAA